MHDSLQESGATGTALRPGCLLLLPHTNLAQSPRGSDHPGVSVPFPRSVCLTDAAGELGTQSHFSKYACAQTTASVMGAVGTHFYTRRSQGYLAWLLSCEHCKHEDLVTCRSQSESAGGLQLFFIALQTQLCENTDLKHDDVRLSVIITDAWCYAA